MTGKEFPKSKQLLELAHELGLFNTDLTKNCTICHAIFPESYGICPKCFIDKTFSDVKIDFEF